MNGDDAAQVRAAAEALGAAIVTNDPHRIAALLADDWRLVDADGVTTRQQFLSVVASGRLTHARMHAVGDVEIRMFGDVGLAFARVVNTADFDGRTFEADEWTTDVFIRSERGWLCAHSHVTPATSQSSGSRER